MPLEGLCAWLGQIPVGRQPIPYRKMPMEWESYSDLEWEHLIAKAQGEGLAPLLYWELSRPNKLTSIPESAQKSLRRLYSETWANNKIIIMELETLAHFFKQAGIALVVLKGACLALTIYPDIGLRPMGDLDVLVPGDKRSMAEEIARSFGYEDQEIEASPGLHNLLGHDVSLKKTGSPSISLEIHSSLVADRSFLYAVPVDWFWEQIEHFGPSRLIASDLDLLMLTPTAQVLYAAAHAMLQHGGRIARLRWFYDIDRLIRFHEKDMDWELVISKAFSFEWGSALEAAISKTIAYFNTPVPEHVLTSLAGSSDRNKRLVNLKQIQPATHVLDEQQKLLSLDFHGRIRLILALIAPSAAYMRWRYGMTSTWLLPVYYLWRWIGILKDSGQTLLHLLHRTSPVSQAANFSNALAEKKK